MTERFTGPWIVDQANFDAFLNRMDKDPEFARVNNDFLKVVESEEPYVRLEAYWDHNQWIHDNGHVDVKDALWDWIEGRR